ncbi:MAG TPA: hypothetical protein ENH65_03245 [Candidatus Aminicenantes bacterium]|nr:hypothetical protein [Candidatus Aminicenantes bacterium]
MLLGCLVGLVVAIQSGEAQTAYKPTHHKGGVRITPHRNDTQPYLLQIERPAGTTVFSVDNAGRVNQEKIVELSAITAFSTWGAPAVSGSSYYQMEDGVTYIVDPVALVLSRGDVPLNTGGGVTLHLPLADADSHLTESKVIWAQGDSGTSATPVAFTIQVWPAPLAGSTVFRGSALAVGSQNMTAMATSGSSVISTGVVGSWNINSVGESGVWILVDESATSGVFIREGGIFP